MRGWETQSLHSGRGYGNGTQQQCTTNTVSGSDLELWWEREVLMEGCLQGWPSCRTHPGSGSHPCRLVSCRGW